MSKKLPKAIGLTIDDLRRAKPNLRDETKSTRVSLASIPSPVAGGRAGDVLADEVRSRLAKRGGAARQSEKLALVPGKKPKAGSGKPDAPADNTNKSEKPAGST